MDVPDCRLVVTPETHTTVLDRLLFVARPAHAGDELQQVPTTTNPGLNDYQAVWVTLSLCVLFTTSLPSLLFLTYGHLWQALFRFFRTLWVLHSWTRLSHPTNYLISCLVLASDVHVLGKYVREANHSHQIPGRQPLFSVTNR